MLTILHSCLVFIFKASTVKNKLDYLDGYRGFLALNVMTHHFAQHIMRVKTLYNIIIMDLDYDIRASEDIAGFIGVSGFFILSAFLLTYRLTNELEKYGTTYIQVILSLIKYTIRRFFRIYLVFCMFWVLVKNGPHVITGFIWYNQFQTFYKGLQLEPLNDHLWTIPQEIRFYFFIPLISIIGWKLGKLCIPLLFMSLYLLKYNQPDIYTSLLNPHLNFTVFNYGSILAIFYFNLQKIDKKIEFIRKNFLTQSIITFSLLYLLINQYKLNSGYVQYGQYQIIIMFLMLLSESNVVLKIFSNSFLRSCGKYSFGMYLFHPMCFQLTLDYLKLDFGMEYLITGILLTYFVGCLWFFCFENLLMRFANFLCKKLENVFK